jgi:hypothetical protein
VVSLAAVTYREKSLIAAIEERWRFASASSFSREKVRAVGADLIGAAPIVAGLQARCDQSRKRRAQNKAR